MKEIILSFSNFVIISLAFCIEGKKTWFLLLFMTHGQIISQLMCKLFNELKKWIEKETFSMLRRCFFPSLLPMK
jgi:hypothetical protein